MIVGGEPSPPEEKAKPRGGRAAAALVFAGLLLLLAGTAFWWLARYAAAPARPAAAGPVVVSIPANTGLPGIRAILAEKGVITDDPRFTLLARLLGVAHRLKAGEYRFEGGETPYEILAILESGRVVQWPLTIPEGANIEAVATLLEADGWGERQRILALCRNREFAEGLKIPGQTLEGYLFPDTYYLVRGMNGEQILGRMVERFFAVAEALGLAHEGRLVDKVYVATQAGESIGLSVHEVVTLASIVEKETGVAAERPLIASVFLNRLQRGMRLQSDPTVIYGLADFNGNLTRKDLRTPTPYNTYTNTGLPPGPIASPGQAAIEAVLQPAQERYLYFVSKNDGSHYFSESLTEHNRAVRRYQRLGGQ